MAVSEYPLPAFHFLVEFSFSDSQSESYDNYFQSVSGPGVEIQTETIKEGGENRFEHSIPVRTKYSPLVLKRGVLNETKAIKWCRDAFENFKIVPISLSVKLLDESHSPLIIWDFTHARPKK